MHMTYISADGAKKKRLVVSIDQRDLNQLKWVAMKRRVTLTQLIADYSNEVFAKELPDKWDQAVARRAMIDMEHASEIPFE